MDSRFEEFVGELQKRLWLGYSKTVIDHAQNPRNVGRISNPDGYGSVTGSCGDTMQIWLRVRDDTISNATFWTDGCGTTIAAGSMITELAKGRNTTEAQRISPDIILNALEGLPEESQHCAVLASETLNAAVRSYLAIAKKKFGREAHARLQTKHKG